MQPSLSFFPLLSLTLCWISLAEAAAQDQAAITRTELEETVPKQIGVWAEFIVTDAETALALAAGDHETPARTAIEPLLEDGTAQVAEMAYILTRSGSQAKVESIVELIYPTEYDPPELPQKVRGPIAKDDDLRVPATPTAYETRNLGLTLAVTPQISPDPSLVELDVKLDEADFAGTDAFGQEESRLEWPRFHSKGIIQNIVVRSGEDHLLGILEPGNDPGDRRLLAFVRADVLPLATIERVRSVIFPNRSLVPDPPPAEDNGPDVEPPGGDPFAGVSDDPFESPEGLVEQGVQNVSNLVEVIRVPGDEVGPLIRKLETANASAIRATLETLPGFQVVHAQYGLTKNTLKGTVRSGNERIYPVEMDPAELPQEIQGPLEPGVRLITPASFTTHEMRSEGFEVAASPQALNNVIDCSLAVSVTRRAWLVSYGEGLSRVEMPVFATNRVSTNVVSLSGDYTLVGVFSEREDHGPNKGVYSFVFSRPMVRPVDP